MRWEILVLSILLTTPYAVSGGDLVTDPGAEINAAAGLVGVPEELGPLPVGILTWASLFLLVGVVIAIYRFMRRGEAEVTTGHLLAMAILAAITAASALLFALEALGRAATQYLGLYASLAFFGLALLTAIYYRLFIPHTLVEEDREEEFPW